MRTTVETDATTVRVKQHSNRCTTKNILALMIWIVLTWAIIIVFFVYVAQENKSDSAKARRKNHSTFGKSIHSVANNYGKYQGIVNTARKRSFEICFDTTWLKTAVTVVGGNGNGSELNQLAQPNDMFVDTQNAIYIADSLNHRIVKWMEGDHQGRVVAGGNGKGNHTNQLNYPTAVFVDRLENIYVADNANNRIQKWPMNSKNGETIIGQFGRGNRLDQFDNCWGLYVDKKYNVYVSELANHRVTKWSPGAQSGQIVVETWAPLDIHVQEETGDIYVTSYAGNSIRQFATDGSLIRQFEKNLVKAPFGFITIANVSSENAYIFVANSKPHRILQISMDNLYNMTNVAGTSYLTANEQNQFNKPKKVQFDSRGNLLVLDSNNYQVQKFYVENNSCDVIYPSSHRSLYSTRSPHHKQYGRLSHMDIIQKWYDQKISDNANPQREKGSPIGENFFPNPPFREFSRPVDIDVEQTWKNLNIDIPKVSSVWSGGSGKVSSFRSRGGRKG